MDVEQAISELNRISQILNRNKAAVKTEDAVVNDELSLILRDEQLARDFADATNAVGRRLRSREDCRPGLRSDVDRRAHRATVDAKTVTAEADAASYSDSMRSHLRK
jgi:hypothetical protein